MLRTALARARALSTIVEQLCSMAVLDAMVRIRADVPAEEVAPFLTGCGDSAALVLLAQHPQRSVAVLLEFLEASGRGKNEDQTVNWLAAGGLLLGARAHGFAGAIAQAREQIEGHWRRLRGELVRPGLLDRDDQRGAAPMVRLMVYDDRHRTDPPLPPVPGATVQERRGMSVSR